MKKQTNIFESLLMRIGFLVIVLILVNSLEFNVTITKKRNSIITSVVQCIENGYNLTNQLKSLGK